MIREFLSELRDHWDDGYWWADRQLLLYGILLTMALAARLAGAYLEMRIAHHGR